MFLFNRPLIDQTMFTHFQEIYKEFRSVLKFPKIYQHGCGMESPSIFFEVKKKKSSVKRQFEYEKGSKEVNWDTMETVAENFSKTVKIGLKNQIMTV